MKISELMEKLGEIQGEHGDIEVEYYEALEYISSSIQINEIVYEKSFKSEKVILK